jgi:hypothetical protein
MLLFCIVAALLLPIRRRAILEQQIHARAVAVNAIRVKRYGGGREREWAIALVLVLVLVLKFSSNCERCIRFGSDE